MKTAIRSGFLLAVFAGAGAAAGAPLNVEHVLPVGGVFPGLDAVTLSVPQSYYSINNHGDWVAQLGAAAGFNAIVGSMGVVATSDDDGNPDEGLDTFSFSTPAINNRGDIVYSTWNALDGNIFNRGDTLTLNGQVIRTTGDPTSIPTVGHGFTWDRGVRLTDSGIIHSAQRVVRLTDGGSRASQGPELIKYTPQAGGLNGYTGEPLVVAGMELE